MALLVHNLVLRRSAVEQCYPGITVYWLGDAAHQTEHSDHNPDSTGTVHAIDIMVDAGTARAAAILKWVLSWTFDLQYVIHNRVIYTRANNFQPAPYSGTDPHTNHIHVSGKHGNYHESSMTGVGYDLAAEQMNPPRTPCSTTEVPTVTWLKGCDFSYSKPDLQQLWDAGYRVILIYLSDSGKGFSDAYAQQALSLGFKILPLYETTAGAALGGFATGVAHATYAIAKAKAQGIPPEVPIIYALDQDYSTAQLAGAVSDYVKGLASVPGEDDLYGGFTQLQYLIKHGVTNGHQDFQTYAWSGGQWLPVTDAPIEQYQNNVSVAGGTVDNCRVQDGLIFWEQDMAITDADAVKIANAVWNDDIIPADPTNAANPNWQAKNAMADVVTHVRAVQAALAALPAASVIAAAVVAALPPASTGGLTADDVSAAVHTALAKLSLTVAP